MITAEDTEIKMTEGDFGVALPIEISVEQLTADDVFSIKIFKSINTEPLIIKEYSNIKDNIIEFKLTKEDSLKLSVGKYKYDLDWYQGESFLENIIAKENFIVEEKAGVVNENSN